MIFSLKNINNLDIITIQAKNPELSENLMLIKTIFRISKLKRRNIIINLGNVFYPDNSFFEGLISAQKFCRKNDSIISLCGINHEILCVLYLLKLDLHFEIYENEYDAVYKENRLIKRRLKVV